MSLLWILAFGVLGGDVPSPFTSHDDQRSLRRAITHPMERAPLERLARRELDEGRPSTAISLVSELMDRDVESPRLLALLAEGYRTRARQHRQRGTADDRTIDLALLDAADLFRRASLDSENFADVLLMQARCHIDRGDFDRAKRLAKEFLEIEPDSSGAHGIIGECHLYEFALRLGDGESAEDLRGVSGEADRWLSRARFLDPGNAVPFARLGDLRFFQGQAEQAALYYRDALLLDPAHEDHYALLLDASAASETDPRPLLEEIARNSVEAGRPRKSRAIAHLWWGRLLLKDRLFLDAAGAFAHAASDWPDWSAKAYLMRALAHHGANDYDSAGSWLLSLVSRGPGTLSSLVDAHTSRKHLLPAIEFHADRYVQAGNQAAGRDLLRELVVLAPERVELLNNVAFMCRETGLGREALQYYRDALKHDPDNPRLLNDTAVILHYYLKRDFEEAKRLYERAIEEGERRLGDPATRPPAKREATSAVKDARENLTKLNERKEKGTKRK